MRHVQWFALALGLLALTGCDGGNAANQRASDYLRSTYGVSTPSCRIQSKAHDPGGMLGNVTIVRCAFKHVPARLQASLDNTGPRRLDARPPFSACFAVAHVVEDFAWGYPTGRDATPESPCPKPHF
jgi:hypothetical protein